MKKLFLLLLFFMQAKGMYAQTQVDTIGLLKQTILNNKTNFIGKPFSMLVNALPTSLPIKHYFPEMFNDLANRQTKFGFIDIVSRRRGPKNIIYIYIYIGKIRLVRIVNLLNGVNCLRVDGIRMISLTTRTGSSRT